MLHEMPLIATIVAGLGLAFVFGAIANRESGRDPERVESVDIAPGRQDFGSPEDVATGDRANIASAQRADDAVQLAA